MEEIKKNKFHNLLPVDDIELGIYEDAINFALNDKKILNVAISGSYGSGKSSIIESYINKNKYSKKFIQISLTHFIFMEEEYKNNANNTTNDNNNDKNTEVKKERNLVSILETKILNQLIHQIPYENIPQTDFKIKKEKISPLKLLIYTVAILIFFLSFLHILFFKNWHNFITTNFYNNTVIYNFFRISTFPYALFFSASFILIILTFSIYKIIKLQKTRIFLKKLSIQGNEIEISEESNDSYFDKYLNEVLYIFENSNADVIVFEDIDRYEVCEIFERLREVNKLVNNKLKEKNKSIKFFYLLRDDIFTTKDRTKFFDFVIPVIPVIDSSNSLEMLLKLLANYVAIENINDSSKLDKRFLYNLSLYIDDMRLIKNICNEFIIYLEKINNTEIKADKLFAMITYKNFFPKDFSDLQLRKGYIFSLFSNKKIFSFKKFNSKIRELKLQKEKNNNSDIDKEILFLEKEMSRNLPLKDLMDTNNFNFFNEKNDFKEIKENHYFGLLKYLISKGYLDETYASYMTYFYPFNLTIADKNFLLAVLSKEKKEYIYKLDNPNLILDRLSDEDFLEVEILNFSLLNYLLKTEDISSQKLKSIFNQLKDSKNFNFIKEYLKSFILIEDNDYETIKKNFTIYLNSVWDTFFSEANTTISKFEEIYCYPPDVEDYMKHNKDMYNYMMDILDFLNYETLKKIDEKNNLKNYIDECTDFFDFKGFRSKRDFELLEIKISNSFSLYYDNFVENLKHLNIKLKKIIAFFDNSVSKEVLKNIYTFDLYELNFDNINTIINNILYKEKSFELKELRSKNYSLIKKSNSDENIFILDYINTEVNMNKYIELILENCGGEIHDDIEYVLELLNNENLKTKNKENYIKFLCTKIIEISSINEKNLWDIITSNKKMEYSEKNIIIYFSEKGLNEELITFLNSEEKEFINEKFNFDEELEKNFFLEILSCNDLNDVVYKNLLTLFKPKDNEIDFPINLSEEKIKILINLNIMQINKENLEFIREYYEGNTYYFIKFNIKNLPELISNGGNIYKDELLQILSDEEIQEDIKLKLLESLNSLGYRVTISDKNYPIKIQKYILENFYDDSEFLELIKKYEEYEDEIKDMIFDKTKENIEKFSTNFELASKELRKKFLTNKDFTEENKEEILYHLLDKIDDFNDFYSYIKELKLKKFYGMKNENQKINKNIIFEVELTSWGEDLLWKMREKGFIEDYDIVEGMNYSIRL